MLACGREALGGRALAAVSALQLTVETTPDASQPTGRPSINVVTLRFPNQYREVSEGRELDGRPIMTAVRRIDAQTVSVGGTMGEVSELDAASVASIRHFFARAALMWLLRETPTVPLVWSTDVTVEGSNIRIAATGPGDFNVALLLDRSTCLPAAMMWERPPHMGDTLRARGGGPAVKARYVVRRDLMDYRPFDGVRLPTRVRALTDDVAMAEERLTVARVNPALAGDLFRPGS